MATGKRNEKTDYGAIVRQLRQDGAKNLYLLWGEEDYLRDSFYEEIKKLTLEEGCADFNFHRLSGSPIDPQQLAQAVDSVPFMGERSLVEVRGFEINACKDSIAESIKNIISDIPDYCTVVFILPTSYEPDGRLALTKAIKKQGEAIEFTTQPHGLLISWIARRFESCGKKIGREECERLIFLSGERMTGLVQEIEKIAASEKNEAISMDTIDKVAHHIPEARIFEMTDAVAAKRFDDAAMTLAELLQSGEHPIKTLAMLGMQMRRLYAARVALDKNLGSGFVAEICKMPFQSHVDSLLRSAKGFSTQQLKAAVALCAEADYRMKSSSDDDEAILKELFLRIAVGATV